MSYPIIFFPLLIPILIPILGPIILQLFRMIYPHYSVIFRL